MANPVAWALAIDVSNATEHDGPDGPDVWYLLAFVDDKALVYDTFSDGRAARAAFVEATGGDPR